MGSDWTKNQININKWLMVIICFLLFCGDAMSANEEYFGGTVTVTTTDKQFELEYDASNQADFTVDSSGNFAVAPNGKFWLQPSGDVDDYLEFYTSSNIPYIKRIGGGEGREIILESDDADLLTLRFWEDAPNFFDITLDKANDKTLFNSQGDIYLRASGDADDYIKLYTSGNLPALDAVGAPYLTTGALKTDGITSTGLIQATTGFDIVGAADIDYGSADVTDHTFVTDGTGTGEIVLPAGSIDGTEILDDTVDSDDYAAGSIDAEHLAADIIDETKMADNSIDSEHYNDGSIDAAHLAADVIDETKIADDGVDSEHYNADSVDNEHINWADIDNLDNEGATVVADTTDTTCFPALWESATGSLAAKTDAGITYNAGTGALKATGIVTQTIRSDGPLQDLVFYVRDPCDPCAVTLEAFRIDASSNRAVWTTDNAAPWFEDGMYIGSSVSTANWFGRSSKGSSTVAMYLGDSKIVVNGASATLASTTVTDLTIDDLTIDDGTHTPATIDTPSSTASSIMRVGNAAADIASFNLLNSAGAVNVFRIEAGKPDQFQMVPGASKSVYFFESSADGETEVVQVHGEPTGKTQRLGQFQITDNVYTEEFEISTTASAVVIPDVFHTTQTVFFAGVYDDDIGTERPLLIQADGQIGYDSSTRARKEHIEDFTDYDILYSLKPKRYTRITTGKPGVGLIAEDLDELNINETIPGLVTYGRKKVVTIEEERQEVLNDPCDPSRGTHEELFENEITTYIIDPNTADGINHYQLIVPLLAEVQKLKARIEELEERCP